MFTTSRLSQIAFALSLAVSPVAVGCVAATDTQDVVDSSQEAITDVNHSTVKRQSIGNCWTYATASWIEAMHKNATGTELNVSESYITFWHWFEQIQNGDATTTMPTGGSWDEAKGLITRYGVVLEGDFISTEANAEMSAKQKSALTAIEASLKSGKLKDRTARNNATVVFSELVAAWKLTATVSTQLEKVFGTGVTRDLTDGAVTAGTIVKSPREIAAAYTTAPGKPMVKATLADAFKTWRLQSARTTRTAKQKRDFEKRVQRALHDNQPVIISCFVDFNALDSQGRFAKVPATPGHQGGHMTVMEDYEIDSVPGFGTLKAGVLETRPAALNAALSDTAKIKFIRVKNSWGISREDRQFSVPGYHDLYADYLWGTAKRCTELPDGSPDVNDCWDVVPFSGVVLPSGY